MTAPVTDSVGRCCIVLHTHLPWVAHAGAWPVGEEWLHQAWSASYRPVVELLERLAGEDRTGLVTVGVSPVLAAMLDDPYCLRELHTWLGGWQTRAQGLAGRAEPHLREQAGLEFRGATAALADFETRWRHGASPLLRRLAEAGTVELLGGPATHPFQPLLEPAFARFQLAAGREDAVVRLGQRSPGIWAPECGYRPGLETLYAEAGVTRFLVDGPTLIAGHPTGRGGGGAPGSGGADPPVVGSTADGWTVGDTDVVAFGRDLEVTYRVWSPRHGYPGGRWYRDFHTFDHASGFRPARVTSTRTPSHQKRPYDPAEAAAAVTRDAEDFVGVVRGRLLELAAARDGRAGTVVVAYDTELFGHWWHEGPAWLEAVLRRLPTAGVTVSTLGGAVAGGAVAGRADLPAGSWGSGKDWRVWEGSQVQDLVAEATRVQQRLIKLVGELVPAAGWRPARSPALDQLAREALLVTSSDWAFCVSKDTAADYARSRAAAHTARFHRLADLLERRSDQRAAEYAGQLRATDGPFGTLDARLLAIG